MNEILAKYWDQYTHLLPGIVRSLIAAIVIILGGRLFITIINKMIRRAVESDKVRIDDALGTILRIIINYAVIFICAIMILENFGFNTAGLIALVGAAGVTIGLALQNTLSNIAAGIILLVLRPFRKGDLIEFGANTGHVRELGLFVTIIETNEGVFISVPNTNLWGPPLRNYSRSKRRRLDIPINLAPGDDLAKLSAILEEVSHEEKRILPAPPPRVIVQPVPNMTSANMGITLILRAWIPNDQYAVINQDLLKAIRIKISETDLKQRTESKEQRAGSNEQ